MTKRTIPGFLVILGVAVLSARAEDVARVGSETCAACHADLAQSFRTTAHAKADPEGACETCHGAGGRHVEEGSVEAIGRFDSGRAATERSAACLACHGRDPKGSTWGASDHALGALACDDCHDPHGAADRPALLRTTGPALCFRCHAETRAQFDLPTRHPVGRGAMGCVDCHDPHGASDRRRLGGFKQSACMRCHTEYRGPWVFEHEVVAVEGCVACHTPHGSVNRHLLAYQRVGDLCLQCHPEQPFFHVVTDGEGQRTTGINDCTRCHTEIHGSNNDALFLN